MEEYTKSFQRSPCLENKIQPPPVVSSRKALFASSPFWPLSRHRIGLEPGNEKKRPNDPPTDLKQPILLLCVYDRVRICKQFRVPSEKNKKTISNVSSGIFFPSIKSHKPRKKNHSLLLVPRPPQEYRGSRDEAGHKINHYMARQKEKLLFTPPL